jgi:phenylalanine-4-hydroxylase
MAQHLPDHLKKYVVSQNYDRYTPVDQAVWRYILRQLKSFLGEHAHSSYLNGLSESGIEIDRIPEISKISAKLEKFGWRALAVSGFIPPAAFMEMQSLGVLPIACDMRTLDHLLYTPAPDIVHEAAGHAPMLVHPEFAQYLREYAQVARRAIISSEDLNLYSAIRILSDLKENPSSTPQQIKDAQKKLDLASSNISHLSEGALLGRMNWWTAEYGLIGDINKPKIFGAGLLSSVGEAQRCLSDKVRKIPLTADCVNTGYDITEPQPQLFVTPDFKTLSDVLKEFAKTTAYQEGGSKSVQKAILAKTVNTVVLNSGLQISGVCVTLKENCSFIKFQGPTQLAYKDVELSGHSNRYHKDGFSSPLGYWKLNPEKCPSTFSATDLKNFGFTPEALVQIEFLSGIQLQGTFKSALFQEQKLVLLSFDNCKVTLKNEVLFDPAWGAFDMAVGTEVSSVFGGPADRGAFGSISEDFTVQTVPSVAYSAVEKQTHEKYRKVRSLRESAVQGKDLEDELTKLMTDSDWLLLLETYELLEARMPQSPLLADVRSKLDQFCQAHPDKKSLVADGLSLAKQL